MLSARPISLNADVDIPTHTILNTKTPGRKGAKGRSALQENALHNGPKTVLSKKTVLQTPFRPGTAYGKKALVSVSVTRPLMDKTPFPNRVAGPSFGNGGKTPGLKLSKLALLVPPEAESQSLSPDVAPLLRPSSTRKSLRGRISQNFKTPLTKGNHWDVSPGDMEGIGGGLVDDARPETEAVVMDEDDEIEYMPPSAIEEPPYEPPFDLPDYKAMGRGLFELGHGGLVDDTVDIFYAADIEDQVDVTGLLAGTGFAPTDHAVHLLELPELEDDSPFARKPPASKSTASIAAKASGLPSRAPSTRLPVPRTQPPPRPTTTLAPSQPQSRSSSRTTTSSGAGTPAPIPSHASPALVVAPGQTRTSALRAAKAAAASNNASTPIAARPTTAGPGARPAAATTARKPGVAPSTSAAAGPKVPVRAASTMVRSAASTGTTATIARSRSATVIGRARPVSGVGAPMKSKVDEDPLAVMLKQHAGNDDDFQFEV